MGLISLKDVSKLYGFPGATTVALDEVSLEVDLGEFVGIMGPSGSGKSTLLYIIGLLERPTNGVYRLNGRSVEKLKINQKTKARRDKIGFIFQNFNLIPNLTVLENVALPLMYKGVARTRRLKKAAQILERVGLSEREYFLPRFLSGGEAQRVAIARALVNEPDIIIADEPTGNLDSSSSRLVMELLSDLHASGSTVLLVTHNPELTRFASRVVFMRDGTIVADESSVFGDVPNLARELYFIPRKTVDDDMKGVSELMRAIPHKETLRKKQTKKKSNSKKYNLAVGGSSRGKR
ncbi:MAG TPA: ABC transporter ATP-binding protein [Candidatus Saccharimonadales bacterium]|nr:ABC transporter ATP-binding protein [Candidatus Saccharimonadales bacterium]